MAAPEDHEMPVDLRWLKRLVTVLTLVMILGIAAIVALLTIRLTASQSLPFPPQITLPEGAHAQAVTAGDGWYGVVTTDGRLLVYSPAGSLRQEIMIETGE